MMSVRATDRPGRSMRTTDPDARARLRAGVRPISLLRPEHIPVGPPSLVGADPHVHAVLLRLHRSIGHALNSGWPFDTAVGEALAALPAPPTASRRDPADLPDPDPLLAAVDRELCVTRVREPRGAAADYFARGIVMALGAYQNELRNAAAGTDGRRWRPIVLALMGLLGRYLHLPPEPLPMPAWEPPPQGHAVEPLRRWVHGRQIGAVLAQGLVWTLRSYEQALEQGRTGRAESTLDLAVELIDAQACAVWHATDFEAQPRGAGLEPVMRALAGPAWRTTVDEALLAAMLARIDAAGRDGLRAVYPKGREALAQALHRVDDAWRAAAERLGAPPPVAASRPQTAAAAAVTLR